MKTQFKSVWVITHPSGEVNIATFAILKNECIYSFISGTNYKWPELRKIGWDCIKVDLSINPVIK